MSTGKRSVDDADIDTATRSKAVKVEECSRNVRPLLDASSEVASSTCTQRDTVLISRTCADCNAKSPTSTLRYLTSLALKLEPQFSSIKAKDWGGVTFGSVLKAYRDFPDSLSSVQPNLRLKNVFTERQWELLKLLNTAANRRLHIRLSTRSSSKNPDGKAVCVVVNDAFTNDFDIPDLHEIWKTAGLKSTLIARHEDDGFNFGRIAN